MNILQRYTISNLKKNKSRTIVTIIGIILSLSMLTAVTTLIASTQKFLTGAIKESMGDWYGAVKNAPIEALDDMAANEDISHYFAMQLQGYSPLQDSLNPYKPYLFIAGIDENFAQNMPVHLISGRLPQNETELLLPQHLSDNGGIEWQIGQEITLEMGNRLLNGEKLTQYNPFETDEQGVPKENFEKVQSRTFHIVGIYQRPSFEQFAAPGYTALTAKQENLTDATYDVYLKTPTGFGIYSVLDRYTKEEFALSSSINYDLLRFMGASNELQFNGVLYGISAILISIIVLASISLIYNAFSISVNERMKQFGLLSSIGATKKQLKQSVIFEALVLCCVGIPLGVLSGIVGIGVTLAATKDMFVLGFGDGYIGSVPLNQPGLQLNIAPWAIALAVVLGLVTVLISAYIPAKRAVKFSAIDAIRQNGEIKLKSKAIKVNPVISKIFGFEGTLAIKNFKRNRRRYRATIFSLFISVVLFISASSLCGYLTDSVNTIIEDVDYDISYFGYFDETEEKVKEQYEKLKQAQGVQQSSYYKICYGSLQVKKDALSSAYLNNVGEGYLSQGTLPDTIITPISLVFVQDEIYSQWLKSNGYDSNQYMHLKTPLAIANNSLTVYNTQQEKYLTCNPFKNSKNVAQILEYNYEKEGYYFAGMIQQQDKVQAKFVDVNYNEETGQYISQEVDTAKPPILYCNPEDIYTYTPIEIDGFAQNLPFGMKDLSQEFFLLYPEKAYESMNMQTTMIAMRFKSSDPKVTFKKMAEILGNDKVYLSNYTEIYEMNHAIIGIINVFAYGFIILISLISAANVFNTISTNISLRKKEFAMLKSIGMTDKGFYKMMNLECLLYGFKGLIFGLPVAAFISYLIFTAINSGWNAPFYLPLKSIAVACFSVFGVVFSTMIYSTKKIKKENTIDAIKNENL